MKEQLNRSLRLSLRAIVLGLVCVVSQNAMVEAGCKSVGKIPYRITKPGAYCFKKNLSVKNKVLDIPGGASGVAAAIVIETDGVVLDLRGFALDGTSFGLATELVGIYADGWSDIIIRNGTVRGFLTGIGLFRGDDLIIEEIRARFNTRVGIWGFGNRVTVRDSEVTRTGGSTVWNGAFGIIAAGVSIAVENNFVAELVPNPDGSEGISTNGDGFVVNNRINRAVIGIGMLGTEKYRDNLTSEVTTPYTGGIDAGNNQ